MSNFHHIRTGLLTFCVLSLGGCATSFSGDAKVAGGPAACGPLCSAAGMRVSGFVYVGEYSTACVCAPLEAPQTNDASAGAASAAASAGVVTAMRAAQQAAQANQ